MEVGCYLHNLVMLSNAVKRNIHFFSFIITILLDVLKTDGAKTLLHIYPGVFALLPDGASLKIK